LPVSGDYALEVTWKGVTYGGDAGTVLIGGKLNAGLARYCNDAGARNNVTFTLKPETKKVFGIKVLPGKSLRPGEEIFVAYGSQYWEKSRSSP
jgi:hypothetical protein